MTEQCNPLLRQPHDWSHPILQPQDIMRKILSGATGVSVYIGTRRPEAEILHPQCSGDNSWPIHCCTVWYTRYEWYLAAALVGGSVSNLKTEDRDVLLIDLLYMMYLFWSRVLALPPPYNCRRKSSPCWSTSSCVLLGDVNTSRIWELLCDFIISNALVLPFMYNADVVSQPVILWRN